MMKEIIQVDDQYYIQATSCLADDRVRVLKQGETFAVFDCRGDVQPLGRGEQGVFHQGTRFLSRLELFIGDKRPLLLSSTVNERNELLTVDLTNPDLIDLDGRKIARGTLHLFRSRFLWREVCYERLRLVNYGSEPCRLQLSLTFAADFADIFEVRGMQRQRRGDLGKPRAERDSVELDYCGLDGALRRSRLLFSPVPTQLESDRALWQLDLPPQCATSFYISLCCQAGERQVGIAGFEAAFDASLKHLEQYRSGPCGIRTSKGHLNEWINRSLDDLHMLLTETEQGLYPYAGVPWYSTAFGRDGLITALQTLWMEPGIARGVLRYLAAHQADRFDAETDAEPGKILHETRKGEMAALGEIPFGLYYGSVDATPLFLLLAGEYWKRTADEALIREIWPNLMRALEWIDRYGDIDGDGYLEYQRRSSRGLTQQGWKDSWDSVYDATGRLLDGPVALCEVQAYLYGARKAIAELASVVGETGLARQQLEQADQLAKRFRTDFWCEEMNCFALALDGDKQPARVAASNAGQCLLTGIATREQAMKLAERLLQEDFFSGWGIRTVAEGTPRYNPMSYHNGSVWPHDNALIALGLARYGATRAALKIFEALYHLAIEVELRRLPELICGFARLPGQGPVLYPLACSPQAWAAGSVFQLLQACLGLEIDAPGCRLVFRHPVLPEFVDEVWLTGLTVGTANLDLHLVRYREDVGIDILRRTGDVEVVVTK